VIFGSPLIAEYGVEVNGEWFPWNGIWQGRRNAGWLWRSRYPGWPRAISGRLPPHHQICRQEEANNITWVFHVNDQDIPEEDWNCLEGYYPGDEWIDWLGVSVYGAQTPMETEWPEFRDLMDDVYRAWQR